MPGVTYMVLIGTVWFVLQGVLLQTAPKLLEIYAEMDIELSTASSGMFRIFDSLNAQIDQLGTIVGFAGLIIVGLAVISMLGFAASKVRALSLIAILIFMGSALLEMWLMLSPLSHMVESITDLG
ncbi:MAG: hypothetical protein HND57_11925 [Planctomycetes bacterium]|nr:hypothetical protein [Planctomycetota bacterium]